MDSTWETRDLLVLEAAVQHFDRAEAHRLDVEDIIASTGLDEDAVHRALRALGEASPAYIHGRWSGQASFPIVLTGVTERARRAVQAWPTAEGLADRMVEALADAADQEEDEEQRGRLQRLASWFGSAGRDVLVEVAGAAVSHGARLT